MLKVQRRPAKDVVKPHIRAADGERGEKAKTRPERFDVAHALEVFANGALADGFFVFDQFVARPTRVDRVMCCLCGGDAREHGVMVALDARHVDHASRATQERTTGEGEFWQRLIAAFGDRARTVSDPLAAFEEFGDHRVVLEPLEFHVRIDVWVFVVEVNHEAHVNLIVLKVVDERSAACV